MSAARSADEQRGPGSDERSFLDALIHGNISFSREGVRTRRSEGKSNGKALASCRSEERPDRVKIQAATTCGATRTPEGTHALSRKRHIP